MRIVSSLRPPLNCDWTIWVNQVRAFESWRAAMNDVTYVNDRMDGFEEARFIACQEKPSIALLAAHCGREPDWCAIVNADIILGPAWPAVESALRASGAKAAISRRYQLPADGSLDRATLVDQGLDFFAAKPEVWRDAARFVPKQFKLGHILWDTWMLSFFVHNCKCADLTDARVVFHPKHGQRGDQSMTRSADGYLDMVQWPAIRIGPQPAGPAPMVKTEGGGALRI